MGVFKKNNGATKRIVLANAIVADLLKWNGKNLEEVDAFADIKNVTKGVSTNPQTGDEYTSVLVELKDKKIAFPVSRGLAENLEALEDETMLGRLCFNIRNKKGEGDTESDYANYTGAQYISIGLPAEITFEETELIKPEAATAGK
jgi:hypothetical protein